MNNTTTLAEVVYLGYVDDDIKNNNIYRYLAKYSKLFETKAMDGIMGITELGTDIRKRKIFDGFPEFGRMSKETVLFSSKRKQYCIVFSE